MRLPPVPRFALVILTATLQLSVESTASGQGQEGAPLQWVKVPGDTERSLLVQRTRDGRLLLGANESFFPTKALKASGEGKSPDTGELNKGESFAEITAWDEGDPAEWGLWFEEGGDLEVSLEASGGGRFEISLGGKATTVPPGGKLTLAVENPGFHVLRLGCKSAAPGTSVQAIELSGPAAANAAVVRKRWRPSAAHTKFSSSRAPEGVRLWIMEMDAVPGELDFYAPVTTPFGYYGPTWKADGTVNTGFNFSLWSFRRGAEEPPIEELSHLLAIGNPEATFGGFDHEGTGVKIRDWEPLEGKAGQRQALALRVAPGEVYDTYTSYFFDASAKRWRLFGSGNKFHHGKPLESLWVGSFVEVPGPAAVQRTGPYERTMRYRGWVMDGKGSWYPLDRMKNGNIDGESGLTHTDRGVTEDGWFYLSTGGWSWRNPPNRGEDIALPPPSVKPAVDYLDPEDLDFLKTLPCEIVTTGLERRGSHARVSFEVRNAGAESTVRLFWGHEEGLTLAERWESSREIGSAKEGPNQHVLEGIDPSAPLRVRLLLVNREGQFWTPETIAAAP